MTYVRKLFIGGGFTIKPEAIGGNPLIDSYTFEKEQDGVVYRWTGVRPSYITPDGDLQFRLPDQEMHVDGGPYTMQCGTDLAWKNP